MDLLVRRFSAGIPPGARPAPRGLRVRGTRPRASMLRDRARLRSRCGVAPSRTGQRATTRQTLGLPGMPEAHAGMSPATTAPRRQPAGSRRTIRQTALRGRAAVLGPPVGASAPLTTRRQSRLPTVALHNCSNVPKYTKMVRNVATLHLTRLHVLASRRSRDGRAVSTRMTAARTIARSIAPATNRRPRGAGPTAPDAYRLQCGG